MSTIIYIIGKTFASFIIFSIINKISLFFQVLTFRASCVIILSVLMRVLRLLAGATYYVKKMNFLEEIIS